MPSPPSPGPAHGSGTPGSWWQEAPRRQPPSEGRRLPEGMGVCCPERKGSWERGWGEPSPGWGERPAAGRGLALPGRPRASHSGAGNGLHPGVATPPIRRTPSSERGHHRACLAPGLLRPKGKPAPCLSGPPGGACVGRGAGRPNHTHHLPRLLPSCRASPPLQRRQPRPIWHLCPDQPKRPCGFWFPREQAVLGGEDEREAGGRRLSGTGGGRPAAPRPPPPAPGQGCPPRGGAR